MEELVARDQQRYSLWLHASSLDPEEFAQRFHPENTGYAPIRKRDSIGPQGTWEVRTFDTAPVPIAMGAAAIYKGATDRVLIEGIPVSISKEYGRYRFASDHILLPSYETLLKLEEKAITKGLKDEEVVNYILQVAAFAEKGLSPPDQAYLEPVYQMLHDSTNPADELMNYLHRFNPGNVFSPAEGARANLFVRDKYLEGLEK